MEGKHRLKETKGIKQYCLLSDLNYFHVIKNRCADPMHDLNEGAISKLLRNLFHYCIENNIFESDVLITAAAQHDYGFLNRHNIPSKINIDRPNLGQNAAQSRCIFQNLPFILYEYRNYKDLKKIWYIVDTLLRITETVYSPTIFESDLKRMEKDIAKHLKGFQTVFNAKLIPKQHNLTHYPNDIREMGSLSEMSMFRIDAKHREFKKSVQSTNNFINIEKSLAIKHQQMLASNSVVLNNQIHSGKKTIIEKSSKYTKDLENLVRTQINENIYSVSWLSCNEYYYKKNLVILNESKLFEIESILFYNNSFYFVCNEISFISIDSYLNSLKIKISEKCDFKIFDFEKLSNKKSFEIKKLGFESYIIMNSLELRHAFVKNQ